MGSTLFTRMMFYANVGLSNISSEQDTILDSSDTLYQGCHLFDLINVVLWFPLDWIYLRFQPTSVSWIRII